MKIKKGIWDIISIGYITTISRNFEDGFKKNTKSNILI